MATPPSPRKESSPPMTTTALTHISALVTNDPSLGDGSPSD